MNEILKIAKNHYFGMRYEQAVRTIEKFHTNSKATFTTTLFLGRSYDQLALITNDKTQRNKYQQTGIKLLNLPLKQYPNSVQLHIGLGNLYHHMGIDKFSSNKRALSYYKKALSLSNRTSEKADCLNNIANSYQRMGKLNLALKYYLLSINLSQKRNISAIYNLSFIYLKLDDWPKSLNASKKYLNMSARLPESKVRTLFRNSILKNISEAKRLLDLSSGKKFGNTF